MSNVALNLRGLDQRMAIAFQANPRMIDDLIVDDGQLCASQITAYASGVTGLVMHRSQEKARIAESAANMLFVSLLHLRRAGVPLELLYEKLDIVAREHGIR